ncbi:uncharacterized protein E0L32_006651 [Thyridium curvatum]|uniref:NAD-dependent epimerase/dehydratase domain-containing protein n=1 Tax=Thyridium curvatum TaxID=1093900 RepID=A0A507B1S2_9PEZI|nr:uncharacterized protein E0L32_006651 [Thyridium curvatum]TPX13006.1 hypothetical protein E0L32_006651 [Thyridium curvatum]
MPSALPKPVLPPSCVLVTGANGFIAQHCVALLLSEGYHVIGTVRSQAKVGQVLDLHGRNLNLSVVVVEDITSVDSYLSALQQPSSGPDAILHLAAPFHYNTTDLENDLMIPAVRGSTAVLDAARSWGTVRRVVHTNSFAGIYDAAKGPQPGKVYTAEDWSPLTYEDGVRAPAAAVAYRASKAVAEKAAWKWMEDNASAATTFDLVSLNPAMVFGAFLPGAAPRTPEQLNTSNQIVYGVVSAGADGAVPPTRGPVWVGVRDVALAHVRALQVPGAGGGRFMLAAGVYCNQEIADVAREVAGKKHAGDIPRGTPGAREADSHFGVDAGETERVLGIKWQGLREVLSELLPQLFEIQERGA